MTRGTKELRLIRLQGYWCCRWYDASGKRHLKRFGNVKDTPRAEAAEAFGDFLREWVQDAATRTPTGPRARTVHQLADAYFAHADSYYVKRGRPTGEAQNVRDALAEVLARFGRLSASEFTPAALEECRQVMIRTGLARNTINARVRRIRRIFKWGVGHAGVPAETWYRLMTVEALKRGRSKARETKPVGPVAQEHIDAALPFMASPVRAMVELQLATGMRPGEVRALRPADIDASGDVWTYTPAEHKTEHLGNDRVIDLGPKAQAILRPFLARKVGAAYLFSRRDALRERYGGCQTHRHQANAAPKTGRRVRDQYTKGAYIQAIRNACEKAGVPRWAPNRLRHNVATRLRALYGIETARAVLGHKKLSTTEVYAEQDRTRARQAMRDVG